MPRIESFRDIDVYQLGLREAKRVFVITSEFPREERLNRMIQKADTFCRSAAPVGSGAVRNI